MFGFIDIVLLAIVFLFTLAGLYYGFIKSLGNFVGLIAGIWIGSFVVTWLSTSLGWIARPAWMITVFFILMMLVSYVVGWIFGFFDGMYKIISIIPFLKSINKLLGGLFGFIEGVFLIIALQVLASFYFAETIFGSQLLDSTLMDWISFMRNIVEPLFF